MSRNRELATYYSYSIGAGATYQFTIPRVRFIQKSTVNLRYNHLFLDYKDFRNALLVDPAAGVTIETAPLYSVGINIVQLFFSIWF